jgi:hypothetical protein
MSGYGYIGHFQGAIKLKGGRRGRHERLPLGTRMIFWLIPRRRLLSLSFCSVSYKFVALATIIAWVVEVYKIYIFEDGGGRNEFRPYNFGESISCRSYADGKKSVSLTDTIHILTSYPAHPEVYGVTSKSASSRTPHRGWVDSNSLPTTGVEARCRWFGDAWGCWIFWGLMGVERKILLYLQIDSTRRAISGLERCYRQYKPKES